ncbi:MAG TPA: hypothetical protein VMW50_04555, partial [Dehalococcoidia bacterium]|nr:hypothetical protein [Dehalococcoidia bacterium]
YVPIPFEQMAGALQMRQRSYEQTAAQRDTAFNALKDIKGHRLDEPAYQREMTKLDQELAELQKKNPDLSSLEAKTGLNEILRSTSRNRFFRDMAANLPVLQQMEEDSATARAENRPWDSMAIDKALFEYAEKGAAGLGQIEPQALAEATDINPTLEAIGRGFIKEGSNRTWNDDLGRYELKEGVSGVSPEQVAAAYGMSIVDGQLQLDHIPTKILTSPDFTTLRNTAKYFSENNPDISYEDALHQVYGEAVAPMVDKYSGYETTVSETMTSKGFSDMEREALSIDFMQHVGRATGDHDLSATAGGRLSKAMGILNDFFITTGNPLAMTAGFLGKRSEDILLGGAKEALKAGVSEEEYVDTIFKGRDASLENVHTKLMELGLPEIYADAFIAKASPFGGAIRVLASIEAVGFEVASDKFPPGKPSEDYLTLAQPELDKGIYSSKDWSKLTEAEQIKLHPKVKKAYKTWMNSGVDVGVRQVDPKTQKEMSTMLWEGVDSNGRVVGDQISGPAASLLTWDPENADDKFILNDKIKKDDILSFIGFVGSDNVYGGGIMAYSLNGKPIWQAVPGLNAAPGHPAHG